MSGRATTENGNLLKLLSLLVAVLIWLFSAGEREGTTAMSVPLRYRNLPPGLVIVNTPPSRAEVTVTGPRILLLRLRMKGMEIPLDLRGAGEGTTVVGGLERFVRLDRELHLAGLAPATVEVKTAATGVQGR